MLNNAIKNAITYIWKKFRFKVDPLNKFRFQEILE